MRMTLKPGMFLRLGSDHKWRTGHQQKYYYRAFVSRFINKQMLSGIYQRIQSENGPKEVASLRFYQEYTMGSPLEEVYRQKGKPLEVFYEPDGSHELVLFYKTIEAGYRVKSQFYFKDDRLVMGVLTFDYLSVAQKQQIFSSIAFQYHLDEVNSKTILKDYDDNYLLINEGLYFDVLVVSAAYIAQIMSEQASLQPLKKSIGHLPFI